jgi:hypothetical protein
MDISLRKAWSHGRIVSRNESDMEKTMTSFGLNITPTELTHFDESIQFQYFQPLVKDGMYFKYPDGKSTPCKEVVASRFPAFASFGQADKSRSVPR